MYQLLLIVALLSLNGCASYGVVSGHVTPLAELREAFDDRPKMRFLIGHPEVEEVVVFSRSGQRIAVIRKGDDPKAIALYRTECYRYPYQVRSACNQEQRQYILKGFRNDGTLVGCAVEQIQVPASYPFGGYGKRDPDVVWLKRFDPC